MHAGRHKKILLLHIRTVRAELLNHAVPIFSSLYLESNQLQSWVRVLYRVMFNCRPEMYCWYSNNVSYPFTCKILRIFLLQIIQYSNPYISEFCQFLILLLLCKSASHIKKMKEREKKKDFFIIMLFKKGLKVSHSESSMTLFFCKWWSLWRWNYNLLIIENLLLENYPTSVANISTSSV